MVGRSGEPGASLELDREPPEHPAAEALEGILRLPVHGCQDLQEGPEERQPEAQELIRVAVVVSIVPEMEAGGVQESLHPVKQAPGNGQQAP